MKVQARVQYTIRDVPRSVDRALRKRAVDQGRSLNAVVLEVLATAAAVAQAPRVHDDLDHLIGSWVHDPETDRALDEQRKVDLRDWQ
ncbi:MAG: hypothetical protein IT373_20370 [Polyangiaceae bacterium]|nr:hypothetical protein [Polyangiaceae bacterium]